MNSLPLTERCALAAKVRGCKEQVAAEVTDDFFQRHPDWQARYGARGRQLCSEDACFHLDFLAGAIEGGAVDPFLEYVRWTTRMLQARRIPAECVAENLDGLRVRLGSRLSPAEHQVVAAYLSAGAAVGETVVVAVGGQERPSGLSEARTLFQQAILRGQKKAATNIALETVHQAHPILDVYVELFQESLYEVGRLWESNQITVAEEHMATAITQYVIAQLYPHLPAVEQHRGKVVITGVAGELHQVGANMVADVLETQGYNVRFLGTNMPHAGIVQAVVDHQAEVLGISATMLFNLPQVIRLVAETREKLGERMPRLILGGAAFRAAPDLAVELGAVGVAADLRAAADLLG